MVQNRTMDILERNEYTHEDFHGESREIIKFLEDHQLEYGTVPEEATVLYQFGDSYTRTVVEESPLYIEDALQSHISYNKLHSVIEVNQPKLSGAGSPKDFDEAVTDIAEVIKTEQDRKKPRNTGTDITKNRDRIEEYAKKLRGEGEEIYKLGIPSLDEAIGGIYPDDLFVIYARPSVGKSYVSTYFASQLHKQGLNILFFSGEMEESQVGYRFDSMRAHVSNKALMEGNPFPQGTTDFNSYMAYLEEMEKAPNFFNIITPKSDFNGQLPTVNQLGKLIDVLKPDIVVVDQISLMRDQDRGPNKVERFSNIVRDLRVLAGVKRTPVIMASQANREGARKDEEGEFQIPELEHLAESDAVGQYATRVLGLASKPTEDKSIQIIKMGLRKNRHGELVEFQMTVNFNYGEIEEVIPDEEFSTPEEDVFF